MVIVHNQDFELLLDGTVVELEEDTVVAVDDTDADIPSGIYPRFRYELINTETEELVASSSKKHKAEREVRRILRDSKPAYINQLAYFRCRQDEEEGAWDYMELAEGRNILRLSFIVEQERIEKGLSTWNNETQKWEPVTD
jgi:hypothetical protein